MPRRLSAALAIVLLALVVVPCVALARGEQGAHVLAGRAGPLYVSHVMLTGKAAKPRGELQGAGSVTICVDKAANSISFGFDQLRVTGQPTAGHIHVGGVGIAGPVVFAFSVPGAIDPLVGDIQWYGTAKAPKGTISALVSGPARYYANVHTKKFPNGAVRGQLGSWKRVQPQDPSAAVCGVA
jgi:hypothetical protein